MGARSSESCRARRAFFGSGFRNYLSLNALRTDLLQVTDEYCSANPNEVDRPAFEPFYFLESVEVMVPLPLEAWTLQEFRNGLEHVSPRFLSFSFFGFPSAPPVATNDFSQWFEKELDLGTLAQRTNHIDIYTNTLDGARAKLFQFIDRELSK